MIYLVSYDLNDRKNYEAVEAEIRALGKAVRVLYSQFLVQSNLTAAQVASRVLKALDGDDGLLVCELTQHAAWERLRISDELMRKWVAAARDCR